MTAKTLIPFFRHVSLHAVVSFGLPAGINVYPGGAFASKEIWPECQDCPRETNKEHTMLRSFFFSCVTDSKTTLCFWDLFLAALVGHSLAAGGLLSTLTMFLSLARPGLQRVIRSYSKHDLQISAA